MHDHEPPDTPGEPLIERREVNHKTTSPEMQGIQVEKILWLLYQEVLKMTEKVLEEGNNQRARRNPKYDRKNKFREASVGSKWRKLP